MSKLMYRFRNSRFFPKSKIMIIISLISLSLLLFFKQPFIVLFLLGIGLISIIWVLINIDNYEYSDYEWTKEVLKRALIFGPVLVVWLVLFLYFLMDLRLITSINETKGKVLRHQSEVYVYKSSGKLSSSSHGVIYSYVEHGNKVKASQKFFNKTKMPKIGNATIVYDSAFPMHNSRLSGTQFHHVFGFLPWLLWLTIGGIIWALCMWNWID